MCPGSDRYYYTERIIKSINTVFTIKQGKQNSNEFKNTMASSMQVLCDVDGADIFGLFQTCRSSWSKSAMISLMSTRICRINPPKTRLPYQTDAPTVSSGVIWRWDPTRKDLICKMRYRRVCSPSMGTRSQWADQRQWIKWSVLNSWKEPSGVE